ncbi:hypothetical protein OKA04_15415 [Luteolibacter flavescens]|uniref:Lipopolysaccharide biosynthesis protein n=1 Tax=Luteolibacter flavescens TaxID=1859460 RepID=A0ABT3FRA1_9BACT|nr:hypothetical protein [Luteolibacter flavescens]MCW1886126.1 hypothetical protein [Luteolibacter flavescens]
MPLAMWALGTAMVQVAPPVYESGVVLRSPAVPEGGMTASLKSGKVIDEAASTLATDHTSAATTKQMLRSQVTWKPATSQDTVELTARGRDPEEARRTMMAVVASYERHHAEEGRQLLVYTLPPETTPMHTPHGTRLMLGGAGLAMLALLLSIPLLRRMEGEPLLEDGWRERMLSAIARASAARAPRPAGGYLPAVQPAG